MAKNKRVRTPEEKRNLENQILKIGLMLMAVAIVSLIVILLVTTLINKEKETVDIDPFLESELYKLSLEEFEEIFSGKDDLDIKDEYLLDLLEKEEIIYYIFYNSQNEQPNQKIIDAINDFDQQELIILVDMDSKGFKDNDELNVSFDATHNYYQDVLLKSKDGTLFFVMKYLNDDRKVDRLTSNEGQILNLLQ